MQEDYALKQKAAQKLIYKIHTKQLKKANWNLTLPLDEALRDYPDCVVSINDSQMLRWIDELNQVTEYSEKVSHIKNQIRYIRRKPKDRDNRIKLKSLYQSLYKMQFQKDYVCVVMDSNKDYDRANLGFYINGIRFRRLLGTNGGVKTSTIVYVNEDLYPALAKRIDNGRDRTKQLVPAKFEAYRALTCSGSTPIPQPNGVIVVHDCMTKFKSDVILINTDTDGEPELTEEDGYEIEHDASDGNGMISPSYSRRVNEFLNGDGEHELTGFNCRNAWTKGMLYTFDFVDFAENVAGSYYVKDVWGDLRDVREADMILTESMLKLWDSYNSMEEYLEACKANHYEFAATKDAPEKLENVRDTNYQFLQDITMSDREIKELCKPTVSEILDVLGGDYRKSLAYLCGYGMDDYSAVHGRDDYIKALMIEPRMIDDPFVRHNIHTMIKKRIDDAKKGSLRIHANFAMLGTDLYALCQSMFDLPVTGLLCAGEIYHLYWINSGAEEVSCFRAPMTSMHNIRKMKLNRKNETLDWFRYIKTACLVNAWDTMLDALNGADTDGDTVFVTDDRSIVDNTLNSKTLMCLQRKATKKIPEERDIIEANKLAFNDDIGIVTNHVTSMIERRAGFDPDMEEYKKLEYRIMCGQEYQQETIDRIKGIICEPMPSYWYSHRDLKDIKDPDEREMAERICAQYKPYFMCYVYPGLKKSHQDYIKNSERGCLRRFGHYGIYNIDDLENCEDKTQDMEAFLKHYYSDRKIGEYDCTINKICWYFEKTFPKYGQMPKPKQFDYNILKAGVEYSQKDYAAISALYNDYLYGLQERMKALRKGEEKQDEESGAIREEMIRLFRMRASIACPNIVELCDIVLDICYQKEGSKQFAWDVAGEQIVANLLKKHGGVLSYPAAGGNEFTYGGENFSMKSVRVGDEADGNYSE